VVEVIRGLVVMPQVAFTLKCFLRRSDVVELEVAVCGTSARGTLSYMAFEACTNVSI
jgi:hypothetical protein